MKDHEILGILFGILFLVCLFGLLATSNCDAWIIQLYNYYITLPLMVEIIIGIGVIGFLYYYLKIIIKMIDNI